MNVRAVRDDADVAHLMDKVHVNSVRYGLAETPAERPYFPQGACRAGIVSGRMHRQRCVAKVPVGEPGNRNHPSGYACG